MAQYSCTGTITSASPLGMVGLVAPGNGPRYRNLIFEFEIGSDAAPADNVALWELLRAAASGTFQSQTPSPFDPEWAASAAIGGSNWSANPALGVNLMTLPLNQRSTFRWMAYQPGREYVLPATQGATLFIRQSSSGAVAPPNVAMKGTIAFQEN